MANGKAGRLVQDLSNVPSIVGSLGLAVAEAQKAFNLDYLDNIERILGLIKALLDAKDESGADVDLGEHVAFVEAMLLQLAPSRYQFTETTLEVSMDLAQTLDVGASAGFSAGVGAIALNASVTVGFGYDYRAAAHVKSVLHAIPTDKAAFNALLGRAKDLDAKTLELPPGATVDTDIATGAVGITSKMVGKSVAAPVNADG